MGERVRILEDATGYILRYRRYGVRRDIRTGVHDRGEAMAMAERLTEQLEHEQQAKMQRRPDWRPAGLEAPPSPPQHTEPRRSFNPPRIIAR
jgi:hypothetical protein